MRKNVRTGKQVIKALSIGLSATLMMQPVSAMADGVSEENSVESVGTEETVEDTVVEVNTVVDAAQEAEKVADAAIEYANDAIDKAEEALKTLEEETSDEEDKVINDVQDSLKTIEKHVENATVSENDVEVKLANAEEALVQETADVSAADKAVTEATEIANDLSANMAAANATIDTENENITNATTIAAADAALRTVNNTAAKAEADVSAAEAEFAEKQAAYTAALDDLVLAKKAYVDAVTDAEADAESARVELIAAQAEADKLAAELEAVKAELGEDAAYSILEQEDERKAEHKENWTAFDNLFYDIIESYYVPEVEKGTNVKVNSFTKFSDDSKNYCEVTYTNADGEKVTKYYNYKLNADKTGLEIFEKAVLYVDYNADGSVAKTYDEATINDMLTAGTAIYAKDAEGNDVLVVLADDENISVSENEVDSFAKTVTFANEEDSKKFENGVVVHVIKADVTTTTRENVSGESGNVYDSTTARDAALADATENLSDVKSEETSVVDSYSSSATYVVYFRDTNTVNETWYERGTASIHAFNLETYYENEHEYSALNRGEYEIGQSGSINAGEDRWEGYRAPSGHWESIYKRVWGHDIWCGTYWVQDDWGSLGHYECTVAGTVTVDYCKTTETEKSYNSFTSGLHDTFIFWEEKDIDKLKAAAKAEVEAAGGIYVDVYAVDWNTKTAKVVYIPASQISATGTYQSKEAAEAAVQAAAQSAAQASGAYGATNVKTSVTTNYKYGYKYTGVSSNTVTDEDATIFSSTTSAEDLTVEHWSNANYINGVGVTDELTDTSFRAWLASAQGKKAAYEALVAKANAAKENVTIASNKVDELKTEIEKLEGKDDFTEKLASLESEMKAAVATLNAAKEELETIKEKAADAQTRYNATVARLTPATTPSTPTTPAATPATTPAATTPVVVIPTVATPAAATPVAAVEEAPVETAEEVTIEEEATPEAAAPEVEEEKTEEPAEVVIDDSETPLADLDESHMNWWWILVVLVLGTAGAELYRRHQVKKNAETVEKSDK